MNALKRSWAASSLATLAAVTLALAGCTEKPAIVADDAGAAANTPPKTVLEGKLGAAVAAAESARASQPSSSAAANGPPEAGVFAPGAADAALAPGAPAKIEVLGEGSEPKVLLSMAPKGDEQKAVVTVSVRISQIAMALDLGLTFKLDKPKSDKDKGDKVDSAAPLRVIATVTSVAAPKEQMGQLPKEIADALAKLKGSEIRYQLSPAGGMSDVSTSLSKDADKSSPVFPLIEVLLRTTGDALSLMSVVVPSTPVGVGGYWMVTERSATYPVDVIRYRVFKVDKIDKDHASFSVDLRQYASKSDADLGTIGGGEKLHIDGFVSQGKGQSEWTAGALLSPGCQVSLRTQAQSGNPKAGGQTKGLQMEISAKSSPAEKSDKKK